MFLKLPTSLLVAIGVAACGAPLPGQDPTAPKVGEVGYSQASLRIALSGSGGGVSQGAAMGGGNGRGPNRGPAVSEALVWVDRVTAHGPGGWMELRSGPSVRVDVMRLAESAQELGFANVVGRVNQIRLHVDGSTPPVVTLADGAQVPLKVPSGEQSGIKVKGLWDVAPCSSVTANLVLEGKRSIWIHPTGHGDLYVLRPVIRAGGVDAQPISGCDPDGEPLPTDVPVGDPTTDPKDPTDPNGGLDPSDPGLVDPTDPSGVGDPANPNDPTGSGSPTDPTGSGSGDPTGSGSGSPTDPTGSGSGDPTGSGSGDPTGGAGDPTGGADGSCVSHGDCGVGFFCGAGGFCSNL